MRIRLDKTHRTSPKIVSTAQFLRVHGSILRLISDVIGGAQSAEISPTMPFSTNVTAALGVVVASNL